MGWDVVGSTVTCAVGGAVSGAVGSVGGAVGGVGVYGAVCGGWGEYGGGEYGGGGGVGASRNLPSNSSSPIPKASMTGFACRG